MKKFFRLVLVIALFLGVTQLKAEDWPQWGGANRNFMTASTGLAASWPASGPKKVWSRELGEGYSGMAVEGGRLYTQYRIPAKLWQFGKKDQEAIVSMDAATGKTIWEHSYDAPLLEGMNVEYGPGPHATPLITARHVFAVGSTGKFFAVDKKTGRPVWSKDLYAAYQVVWGRGYSCSPIAYKDTVILVLGKKGRSVVAFHQETGVVVWEKQDFDYGPGSPLLIQVQGTAPPTPGKRKAKGKSERSEKDVQDQLVIFMAEQIAGLDPGNGELLWSHPHKTDWGLNISTPVFWTTPEGNFLFCSSAYSGGSRALQLTRMGAKTEAKELWFTNQMRLHIGNAIRIGDLVFGSSGDFGPAPFTAINYKTGTVAWRERGVGRANAIYADGKFILLDEDGVLYLATVSPQGMKIQSRAEVLTNKSWTAPTLVGTRLFVRDRKTIQSLDVGS